MGGQDLAGVVVLEGAVGERSDAFGRFARVALSFLMATPFAMFVAPSPWWALLLPLTAYAAVWLWRRHASVRGHVVFWASLAPLLALGVPWPVPFVLPLVLLFAGARFLPDLRASLDWARLGRLDGRTLLLMVPIAAVSSLALVIWFVWGGADVRDIVRMVPRPVTLPVFLGVAVLFSVANALWEECLLKGMMWDGLLRLTPSVALVNVLQASFFGLLHYHGFPRGLLGVVLAGIYGLLLGFIRARSQGMLALVVTHFFADLTICLLIYTQVPT
jgi:uncharacterized protein